MKTLTKLLFAAVVTVSFSLTAFAQKDGDKPPPKEKPPVIIVQPKNPPPEKPKKPEAFALYFREED